MMRTLQKVKPSEYKDACFEILKNYGYLTGREMLVILAEEYGLQPSNDSSFNMSLFNWRKELGISKRKPIVDKTPNSVTSKGLMSICAVLLKLSENAKVNNMPDIVELVSMGPQEQILEASSLVKDLINNIGIVHAKLAIETMSKHEKK